MNEMQTAIQLSPSALTAHEQRVAAMYGSAAEKWFEFSRRVGQRPYSTWGFWDGSTQSIDQAFEAMNREVIALAKIEPSDRVLDVGCGSGVGSLDIQTLTGCQTMVGVDIAVPLLQCGQQLVDDAHKQAVVSLQQMSATELAFEPESFTVVMAIDCAPAFNTRERFLEKAAKVLVAGGRLVLLDVVRGRCRRGWLNRLLERVMMSSWGIPPENRVDTDGLVALLNEKGFSNVTVQPVGARMLPGAVAHMSSAAYRREYQAIFGKAHSAIWQVMIQLLRWMNRRGIFEYVLVSASREAKRAIVRPEGRP